MKNNKKVQIRLVPYHKFSVYKCVEYRIDKSELNWFQRLFNPWRKIYQYIGDTTVINPENYYFEMLVKPGSIDEMKKKFKTIEDIEYFNEINFENYQKDLEIINQKRKIDNKIEY